MATFDMTASSTAGVGANVSAVPTVVGHAVRTIEAILDIDAMIAAGATISDGDVFQLLEIPAESVVLCAGAEVMKQFTASCTADIDFAGGDDIVDGDWRPIADLSHLDSLAESRSIQMTVDRQIEASSSPESYIERVRALLWFNQNLDRIEEGKDVSELLFVALADAMKNYPIQMTHLRTLIQGMEDDLFPTNYCSFEDLRTYCFKVASTVGLCLIDIY